MSGILFTLMVIAMVAVVGVLFAGLFAMARGKNSNVFMRWRVALQGIAILLFVLFMMLYHQS
jgi:hypothetical protein